jgi:hypothetical protein
MTPTAYGQTVLPGTVISEVKMTPTTAAPTVAEASDFTAVADVSGSLGGKTLRFYNAGDVICYQVWYDVDNASVAPSATSGCTLVEVDIAEDDTADTVAGNTRTVLNASPYTTYFAITGATTHVIVTSLTKGAATDGNVMTSGFSVSKTQGVSGTAAITSTEVLPGMLGYRICNAAGNSSTWLAIGKATLDPETDGVRLAPGKCLDCPSCTGKVLTDTKVSAQAASNAYTVVQFKN